MIYKGIMSGKVGKTVSEGKVIIGAGAGMGICAKCEDKGGI